MDNPESIEEAIKLLKENLSRNWGGQGFPDVARYLGESRDPSAFEPLLEGLMYGGDYIRASCALGLGYLGNKKAISYLIDRLMNDKGKYVRCDSALALGYLEAEEALPFFQKAFVTDIFEVQKRIIMAARKIPTQEAVNWLKGLEEEMLSKPQLNSYEEFLLFLIQKRDLPK